MTHEQRIRRERFKTRATKRKNSRRNEAQRREHDRATPYVRKRSQAIEEYRSEDRL